MYSVLLYNYRATRAVENFKEGKQISHNKILRTVFGILTGALLFEPGDHGDRSGGLLIGYIGLITVPVALERTN